ANTWLTLATALTGAWATYLSNTAAGFAWIVAVLPCRSVNDPVAADHGGAVAVASDSIDAARFALFAGSAVEHPVTADGEGAIRVAQRGIAVGIRGVAGVALLA